MKTIDRREFLKYSIGAAGGLAVVVVGSKLSWLSSNRAYAQAVTQTLHFRVTDAMKEMHTHEPSGLEIGTGIVPNEVINDARCYFWIYKSVDPGDNPALDLPPESPGPIIVAAAGDEITITVSNDLDEPHAFFIPGMVDSGPISPGATWTATFTIGSPGGHLYYDNLNEPVNRVMGLMTSGPPIFRAWPGKKVSATRETRASARPSGSTSGLVTRQAPICSPRWAAWLLGYSTTRWNS